MNAKGVQESPGSDLFAAPASAAVEFKVGDRLGKFEIRREIGRGGMGAVYAALHTITGDEVALKVLLPYEASDNRGRDRFVRELKICQKLTHPNIVRIHDIDCDRGVYHFSMELLEGRDLKTELEENPSRDIERVRRIVLPVLDGLQAAHEKGIVHRDLKPRNVFLTSTGEVKILDFGIARDVALPSYTATHSVVGSPPYMGPEQIHGEPELDGRADIYAVGIILYEMLTGKVPFGGNSALSVVMAQIQKTPRPIEEVNPSITPALARAVMTCLQKDRANRYPSARACRASLEEALATGRKDDRAAVGLLWPPDANGSEALGEPAGANPAEPVSPEVTRRIPKTEPGTRLSTLRKPGFLLAGLALVGGLVSAAVMVVGGSVDGKAYAQGYEKLRGGNRGGAEDLFGKLGKDRSKLDRARGFEGIAAVRMEQRKLEDARSSVRAALDLEPGLVYANVIVGDLESATSSLEEALSAYRRALSAEVGLDWQRAVAHCRQAQAALNGGKLDEAKAELDEATRLSASLPELHMLRAKMALAQGNEAEAKSHLSALLEVQPGDAAAGLLLGEIGRRQSLREDAERRERIRKLAQDLAERTRKGREAPQAPGTAPRDGWTSAPRSIWLSSLEDKSGLGPHPGFAVALAAGLGQELAALPGTRVVERELIEDLLGELSLSSSALAQPDTSLKLGRLIGAQFMLAGSVLSYRGEDTVSLRAVEVETSEVVATLSRPVDPAGDPGAVARDLAAEIERKLEERFPLRGRVVSVQDGGVVINIGRLVGVEPGGRFALLDPGEQSAPEGRKPRSPAKRVGEITIRKIDADSSIGSIEGPDRSKLRAGLLVEASGAAAGSSAEGEQPPEKPPGQSGGAGSPPPTGL